MTRWHLTFQNDGLPVAVSRDDGSREMPPPGVVRYIELAHGAWTLEPATKPLAIEVVEWPKPCVVGLWTRCPGTMSYVEHVKDSTFMSETGQTVNPPGWRCDTCGFEESGGLGAIVVAEWEERE